MSNKLGTSLVAPPGQVHQVGFATCSACGWSATTPDGATAADRATVHASACPHRRRRPQPPAPLLPSPRAIELARQFTTWAPRSGLTPGRAFDLFAQREWLSVAEQREVRQALRELQAQDGGPEAA